MRRILNSTRSSGRLRGQSTSERHTYGNETITYELYDRERFRTLTFNLEKPDRTELRTRITSGLLKPSELAHLTSTDLANEKMQQAIESAQQEALHQSILTMRPTAPRAKITHKGEQMIEDDSGVNVVEDLKSIEERMNPQDEQDGEEPEEDSCPVCGESAPFFHFRCKLELIS